MGGSQTLCKKLKISADNSFFYSPKFSTKIWVFADMLHCIKLLRNHFLDKGFILGNGIIINKDVIYEVFNKDIGEIKLCYKLKPQVLSVKGNERQKVAPAKALFSSTTAKAITHLVGNAETSHFFDIMNSSVPLP
ncbi:Transposable element P transposase, partial [Stegodyphus mimosarum]